ncbi:MAG: Na+/H+ antiporter subunit E [Planctomycetota bacterium]|nr:Na+/H+ antiporter subunit E [Planctomycetota bacterium]
MKPNYYSTLVLNTCGFFLIWLLISESFDGLHMGMGILAAFAVAWFNTERSHTRSSIRIWPLLLYFPWLVGRIIQSGFHLSVLILHPAMPIDPKMIRHQTKLQDDGAFVLLGNSITLTPGTITVEAESQGLVVHAMDDRSAGDVTSRRIEQRIDRVFTAGDTK